jgi:hypothetical protein
MGGVWLDTEGHVPAIIVEVPYQGRVTCESLWSGEGHGVVGAPQAPSASEGGQSRRGRETSAQQSEDAGGFGQVSLERGEVLWGDYGCGHCACEGQEQVDVDMRWLSYML